MAIWHLEEEGYDYATFEADSAEEALDEAESNVDRANYTESDPNNTIWIAVAVYMEDENGDTGERYTRTVQCDPPEPECVDAYTAHEWSSDVRLVGGCDSNPGVFGHGGGVIIEEICLRCGCRKVTDTWASNGARQGLRGEKYEPDYMPADDETLTAVREDVLAV